MDFTNYIIDLKDYDSVSYIAPTTLDYPDVRAITLTLTNTGAAERTITLLKSGSGGTSYATSDRGKLFTIKTGVYLVIDGKLTLKGIDATADGQSNNVSLIDVAAGGGLVMKGQSKISGNTNSSLYGGGVYVEGYGIFIMESGAITGNKSAYQYGGGVYVNSNGTFTMTGGSISGNTAVYNTTSSVVTGGVYVEGTFIMTGGSISGNTATNSSGTVINGIYLSSSSSIFKVRGSPQIADTVGLYSYSTISAAITLNGAFTPATAVSVDLLCYDATAYNSGSPTIWDNKAVLKWDTAYTGHPSTFPVDKFTLGKWLERNTSNSATISGKKINSTNGQLGDE
jgi:hypothetical protein